VGNWRTAAKMKIFYRGYVIDEEIRSISYSVFGKRPERAELTVKSTSREAMKWIDGKVKRNAILAATRAPASAMYQTA
jgi:CYTH domain-containing protein